MSSPRTIKKKIPYGFFGDPPFKELLDPPYPPMRSAIFPYIVLGENYDEWIICEEFYFWYAKLELSAILLHDFLFW